MSSKEASYPLVPAGPLVCVRGSLAMRLPPPPDLATFGGSSPLCRCCCSSCCCSSSLRLCSFSLCLLPLLPGDPVCVFVCVCVCVCVTLRLMQEAAPSRGSRPCRVACVCSFVRVCVLHFPERHDPHIIQHRYLCDLKPGSAHFPERHDTHLIQHRYLGN